MRKILYATASIAFIAFASCNLNYSTTKSGTKYKIFSGSATGALNKGTALKVGNIIKFNIKVTIPEHNDTLLGQTYDKAPQYAPLDTGERAKMSPLEIFPLLKSGDSAVMLLSTDSIIAKNPMGNLPPFIKKGQHIKYTVSILNVFQNDSLAKTDYQKEQDKQQKLDEAKLDDATKALDKYITDKGIKAIKTKNGVYVVIDNPGDISLKADSGMQAMVNYTGTVLNGTKPFDSNIDSVNANFHKEPLAVLVGSHRTIEGWDEALPYFAKGAKGKIYIPAKLGYGAQQAGPEIPAFSNLVFDIQVADVTKPAPQAASPMAANPQAKMTPEQQKEMMEQIKKQMEAQKNAKPAGK